MRKFLLLALFSTLYFGCKKHDLTTPPPSQPVDKTPEVQTNDIAHLTHFSVVFSGNILDSFGTKIAEMGFVVDTNPSPSVTKNFNKFIVPYASAGAFMINIDYLPSATTYYVRAYAIDTFGTGYGAEVKFTTLLDKVYNGDITLSTQQQVIDFGAQQYTTINGGLTVTGSVSDLTPLRGLTVINNGFYVTNSLLTNFAGLDSVELTGAVFPNGVNIEYNNNLVDFTGLGALKMTNGDVQIEQNPALQSMNGLLNYEGANYGGFRIDYCSNLKDLSGLKKMQFVASNMYFSFDNSLTDLSGISNLSAIIGRLYLLNNGSLSRLSGLENIHSLPDGIDIENNPVLADISGLANLDSIVSQIGIGSITITNNPEITDLGAFQHISHVDYVTIDQNASLKNLGGLKGLHSAGRVEIAGDSSLVDLTGLNQLTQVSTLYIMDNPQLISLNGLDGLSSITNNPYSLIILRNNSMTSLQGVEHLSRADGTVQILSNPALTDFCPLKLLFVSGYSAWFVDASNASNPTQADVQANCP
jgi:hypothetical protein